MTKFEFFNTSNSTNPAQEGAEPYAVFSDMDKKAGRGLSSRVIHERLGYTFKEYSDKFKAFNDKVDELIGKVSVYESRVDSQRDDSVKTLAILVAFFAFTSQSFTLFSNAENSYISIGIALIIFSLLISFVLLLLLSLSIQKSSCTPLYILLVVSLICGFGSLFFWL